MSSIARFLKDIGRGAAGARALSRDDAREVMAAVLDRRCSEAERGAFVMAMRMKGETVDEIAGFLDAVHARCLILPAPAPVVVLPSYNGARRLPNLTPLLALALARAGVPVLVHGTPDDPGRITSAQVLQAMGLPLAATAADVSLAWARGEPAFVPIALLCAPLADLLALRRSIGLRGPGHTVAKMLAPVHGAPALRLVNHTHPEFGDLMATWAERDGAHAMLLRGTEGEPVADPRRLPRIDTLVGGVRRPELSCAAQDGVLAELPPLPSRDEAADAGATARHVRAVLAGAQPMPAPLARQIELIVAALAVLDRDARTTATPARPAQCSA
jgi:anthranilate phosphoribosyltransferase